MSITVVVLFLAGFLVGCVMLQFSQTSYKTVFVYPTPKNYKSLQYQDAAGTCFHIKSIKTTCDGKEVNIPVQGLS
jgi:hypothetical protein